MQEKLQPVCRKVHSYDCQGVMVFRGAFHGRTMGSVSYTTLFRSHVGERVVRIDLDCDGQRYPYFSDQLFDHITYLGAHTPALSRALALQSLI